MKKELFCFILCILLCTCKNGKVSFDTNRDDYISGTIVDENGPVEFATVRIQATKSFALTDKKGRFKLTGLKPAEVVTVSSWKEGYYCAKLEKVTIPTQDITLSLRKYQITDNIDYEWMPPIGEESCFSCKPEITDIWLKNAHANSAKNSFFISMYNGTSVKGKKSPLTEYFYERDYGSKPIAGKEDTDYYGPGYKLDFPDKAGNCAACHTPGIAIENPYDSDPNKVSGADEFGVHCDFCHKAVDVKLDPKTGLPYPKMPGVLSMEFRRPYPEDKERYQLFFGTFDDDNVPEEDTKLTLMEKSEFCAACHFGIFWDTLIYNSFGEWLASPYSDEKDGKTCQECHMPSPTVYEGKELTNVARGKGGVERDPSTIHAHLQLGIRHERFLQEALTMKTKTKKKKDTLQVKVTLINDNTGHHIPTDSPLRHMILLVRAFDKQGNELPLLKGPLLPDWCGKGQIEKGAFGGYPGKVYAKVLQQIWTKKIPTGAYWNPTKIVSDNRLKAFAKDTTVFNFKLPTSKNAKIIIRLYFRRAYYDLLIQKGMEIADIKMKEKILEL